MRKIVRLMKNWQFIGPEGNTTPVDLPHTWNAIDGQDGGNDYWRGTCVYRTRFAAPAFEEVSQQVWLQFEGVNASAKVVLNDTEVCVHDGGYSTFRANITTLLREENILTVEVDNRVNDHVYPQKADFTFYGGIYRDVSLLVVHKDHIALGHYGDTGVKVTPTLCKDHTADIRVETRLEGEGTVRVTLNDAEGNTVAAAEGKDVTMTLAHPHLWDGVKDPYLYTCVVELEQGGEVVDTVSTRVGVRSFRVDPKKGFFLNGRSYPLHGVSRHQDRKGLGNAISREMHDEDMALIRELGANTIRLAHYQHDQYFYDLCDEYGMVVWAEIPYISEHLPNGRAEHHRARWKELIYQNYNHPCIVCWGVSNEITISTKDKADMLDNHRDAERPVPQDGPHPPDHAGLLRHVRPVQPGGPHHRPGELEPLPRLVCAGAVPQRPVAELLPSGVSRTGRWASRSTARRVCRTSTARAAPPRRPHRRVSGKVSRVHAPLLRPAPVDVGHPRLEHVRLCSRRPRPGRRAGHEP